MNLVIVFALLVLVALPTWPYSRRWGYRPSIALTLVLVLFLLLVALYTEA